MNRLTEFLIVMLGCALGTFLGLMLFIGTMLFIEYFG